MRTIAIINQKGGVGKTTTAVNLSAALAESGKQVFLIDLDPQAHASLHLGVIPQEGAPSIYDVLLDDADIDEVAQEVRPNLTVLPSHLDLAAAELELAGEVGREVILRDRIAASELTADYILIDCPPSLGVLTLNALTTVNEVLLPMQPHFLALHGLSKLLSTIDVVGRRLNPQLQLSGIVFCMYDRATRLAAEVTRDVESFFEQVDDPTSPWAHAAPMATRIRRNIRLAEAPSFGQSIFEYAPYSNGAADYRCLAEEVLEAGEQRRFAYGGRDDRAQSSGRSGAKKRSMKKSRRKKLAR